MDISLLRKAPQDRIRTVNPFEGDDSTVTVLFAGRDEMAEINRIARDQELQGRSRDDAYNVAYGRVCLRGWDGLLDGAEPLPFTPENCDLLMTGSAEFRQAVIKAATYLGAPAKN